LLLKTGDLIKAAVRNRNYPMARLLRSLNLEFLKGDDFPLFDMVTALENIHQDRNPQDVVTNVQFVFKRQADAIELDLHYNAALFSAVRMMRLGNHVLSLLEQVPANADAPVGAFELLSPQEKQQLLAEFNQPAAAFPRYETVTGLFARQVKKNPENTAVVMDGIQLTYRQLDDRARRLALRLREEGVGPETIVAMLTNRSLEMIVGIMGIIKAGGAYLPVDPEYPAARINYMLNDSGCRLLLLTEACEKTVQPDFSNKRLYLDHPDSYKEGEIENLNKPGDMLYVIYTSGTTGKPKGSIIEHRNVVRLLFNECNLFDFNQSDVWTMFHSYCFDFSVWEMYGALLYGGKLVLVSAAAARDTHAFLDILNQQEVTVLNQTPAAFYNLADVETTRPDRLLKVRYVIFGGEALNPPKLKEWYRKYPATKLINMYGITETTVHVTYKEIGLKEIQAAISNIGKPIPTLTCYILDRNLRLVPLGVPGELCVGGEGVCRGYLGRPSLTAEKFVDHPYQAGEKLYRSGDLARYLENGDLEYLGRIDDQVKIRGYRIELGEIAARLLNHKNVKNAVVVAHEENGDKQLCAYFTADREVSVPELKEFLATVFPDFMIPPDILQLEKIPLTPNGKVDRKALPLPQKESSLAYVAPRNPDEETIARLWSDVLGVERVGVMDYYFNLGGDSIKAIRLLSIINQELDTNLKLPDLYAEPTVAGLAGRIKFLETGAEDEIRAVVMQEIEALKQNLPDTLKTESEIEDIYPMSDIEKGMIFYSIKNPHHAAYHDQFIYEVAYSDFSLERFTQALGLMTEKHAILRTAFNIKDFHQAVQIVYTRASMALYYEDISAMSPVQQQEFVDNAVLSDRGNPFDITAAPLGRMSIFKLDDECLCLLWSCHHAVIDGWSNASFMTELNNTYLKLKTKPDFQPAPLRLSYKDYVLDELVEKKRGDAVRFWKEELSDYKRVDFSGLGVADGEEELMVFTHQFDQSFQERLQKTARSFHSSLKSLTHGAYLLMLSLLSYDRDVTAGLVTNNRPLDEEGDKILGCFLNTVPVRLQLPRDISWADYIKLVQEKSVLLKRFEKLSFFEILQVTEQNNQAGNPLFDTIFNFVDFHVYKQVDDIDNIKRSRFTFEGYLKTNTLFDFNISTTLNSFVISISYSPAVVSPANTARLFGWFRTCLEKMTHQPEAVIRVEEIMTEAETTELLYEFNRTPSVDDMLIHRLFEAQVKKSPDNDALLGWSLMPEQSGVKQSLTYSQLNGKANRLAHVLRVLGVRSDVPAALMVPHSIEMIIGILAVLKAGGAYLPIDVGYPRQRKQFTLDDSNVTLLLTAPDFLDACSGSFSVVDLTDARSYEGSADNPVHEESADNLAYVVYTSGTTGNPKGALIHHRGAVNMLLYRRDIYGFVAGDACLQLFSFAFDTFAAGFFTPVLSGARYVLMTREEIMDVYGIIRTIKTANITHLVCVSALFAEIIAVAGPTDLKGLKNAGIGGDRVTPAVIDESARKAPHLEIVHEYGVTEVSVLSSLFRHQEQSAVITIGKPIDRTGIFILDKYDNLLPAGATGHMVIAGVGLARGYLNRPELTAERFDEPSTGDHRSHTSYRTYKTGDLGRRLPEGNMQFMGRIDHQVKIRGFRIELGEIENCVLSFPQVKETVVVDCLDADGRTFLCAYVVPMQKEEIPINHLKQHLETRLPDYMVPPVFMELEKIPLTAVGKVDRRALPQPEFKSDQQYVAPGNEVEKQLVKIWSEVLGLEPPVIGIDHDFFTLGGHSLKATVLTAKIRKQWNIDVPIADVFKHTTIREMARYLVVGGTVAESFSRIEAVEKKEYYPLSSAQKRIYIEQQMELDTTGYNLPHVVQLETPPDREKLADTLTQLIQRNESLRTSFHMQGGEPVQRVWEEVSFQVDYFEAHNPGEAESIIRQFVRPFDLSQVPLLRAALVKIEGGKHLLVVDVHHIAADGVSMLILISRFNALYAGKTLPPPQLQYKDYALWQNRLVTSGIMAQQEAYWLDRFKGKIPRLNLPFDTAKTTGNFSGERYQFQLDPQLSTAVKQLAARTQTTLFMVLLAAFNILLAKYADLEDIVVGSPVFGRNHADLQTTIGMFVGMLPMRNFPQGRKTVAAFLEEVKTNALNAFRHQDYQFEQLVWELAERSGSQLTVNVVFSMQNIESFAADSDEPTEDDLQITPYKMFFGISKFDLNLTAVDADDHIRMDFEYPRGLFLTTTLKRMAGHLGDILHIMAVEPSTEIARINLSAAAAGPAPTAKPKVKEDVEFDF